MRLVGGSPAVGRLKQGDLLLAIDDKVVTRFREVELAVADKAEVNVTVWRGWRGEARAPAYRGAHAASTSIASCMWAGATLQAPHRAMIAQRGIPPEGVYVGYFAYGSPATRYGLFPGRRIVEVDGVPTPDLDAFLEGGFGPAGSLGHPAAHHHLEQRARSDHAETRSALLAYIRAAAGQ